MTLIEPIEMSQRPPQLPAVMRSQFGVIHSIVRFVPSSVFIRFTTSSAVALSKPVYLFVAVSKNENGA